MATLRVELLEGRYGQIKPISSRPDWAEQAAPYLSMLQPDTVIRSPELERSVLILGDLPGVAVTPLMQPGEKVGTGDLLVELAPAPALVGSIGADNHGNRYSGAHRLQLNLDWNSPFSLGDQVSLRSLFSDQKLWLGSLGYSRPLGRHGLRAEASYSHSDYQLGKEFADSKAQGYAKTATLGLSYPVLRSNAANVKLSLRYQYKRLQDRNLNSSDDKSSQSLPLSLDFDRRNSLGLGGISYGSLSVTNGRLRLSDALVGLDSNQTRGRFLKFNLDLVQQQTCSHRTAASMPASARNGLTKTSTPANASAWAASAACVPTPAAKAWATAVPWPSWSCGITSAPPRRLSCWMPAGCASTPCPPPAPHRTTAPWRCRPGRARQRRALAAGSRRRLEPQGWRAAS